MLERDTGEVVWPLFKRLCLQRFGPAVGTNHLSDLGRLQFRGSVDEYQEAFQAKMAHAGYLSQEQQVHLFTGGLPEALRVDVELQAPRDLQHAMALARAYERRSATLLFGSAGTRSTKSSPTDFPNTLAPVSLSTVSSAVTPPPMKIKRLTPDEMMQRRRQGLCYNCDEQHSGSSMFTPLLFGSF